MLKSDNIVSSNQYFVARILSWFMILILIGRYFQIQIIEHEIYSLKSNTNRIRKVSKNALWAVFFIINSRSFANYSAK